MFTDCLLFPAHWCRSSATMRINCFQSNHKSTGWSKSHATHSWHMLYLSKNKLHWNQKTKNNVVLSVGNVHRVHSFPHVLSNPVKSSCVTETVHQTRYCRFDWHRRITNQELVTPTSLECFNPYGEESKSYKLIIMRFTGPFLWKFPLAQILTAFLLSGIMSNVFTVAVFQIVKILKMAMQNLKICLWSVSTQYFARLATVAH
jgi:hypothetical protein